MLVAKQLMSEGSKNLEHKYEIMTLFFSHVRCIRNSENETVVQQK